MKKYILGAMVGIVAGISFGVLITMPFVNREKQEKEYWKERAESFYSSFKRQNTLLKRCEKIMNKDNVIIMRNYE